MGWTTEPQEAAYLWRSTGDFRADSITGGGLIERDPPARKQKSRLTLRFTILAAHASAYSGLKQFLLPKDFYGTYHALGEILTGPLSSARGGL